MMINRDTNLEIKAENVLDLGPVYFKDIDPLNPMRFAEHTETLNPPQLIKDMANQIKLKLDKKSDMQMYLYHYVGN